MKKHEIITYSFYELSEDAKEKAIQNLWDINVNYDWWEFIYKDAERIGLKITGFDINSYCEGHFILDSLDVCKEIFKKHGEDCETFKTAQQFTVDRDNLVAKYSDGKNLEIVTEDEYEFDSDCDELEKEFLKSLLEDYRIILQKDYEYLTREKAIQETIESNDYEFTDDGKLY